MKIFPFEIPKHRNENLIVEEDYRDSFYEKLHKHQEVQITYICKGSGKLIVWDSIHIYGPGDLFVIGSNCPHVFKKGNSSDVHRISLFFTMETFGKKFFEIAQLERLQSFFQGLDEGYKCRLSDKEAGHLMLKFPKADKFKRFLMYFELIEKLCKCEKSKLTSFVAPRSINNMEGKRMRKVLDYVFVNFQKNLTLEEVAEIACMTPTAFCRFFKQRTNKTFFSFLIEMRIEYACQLLKENQDLSVSTAANRAGFNSITNFNRKFKLFKGITPSVYLKGAGVSQIA